jgi:hypothetical protein
MNRKNRLVLNSTVITVSFCICCGGIAMIIPKLFDTSFTEIIEPFKSLEGVLSPPSEQVLERVVGSALVSEAQKTLMVEEKQVGAPLGTVWRWKRETDGRFRLEQPLQLYDVPEKVVSRIFPLWRFSVTASSSLISPLRPAKGEASLNGKVYFHIIYQYHFLHRDFKELVIATRQQGDREELRFLALAYWDGDEVREWIWLEDAGVPTRRSVTYTEAGSGREWHFEFVRAK